MTKIGMFPILHLTWATPAHSPQVTDLKHLNDSKTLNDSQITWYLSVPWISGSNALTRSDEHLRSFSFSSFDREKRQNATDFEFNKAWHLRFTTRVSTCLIFNLKQMNFIRKLNATRLRSDTLFVFHWINIENVAVAETPEVDSNSATSQIWLKCLLLTCFRNRIAWRASDCFLMSAVRSHAWAEARACTSANSERRPLVFACGMTRRAL